MSFLKVFSSKPQSQGATLLERLSSSTQLEDRREAIDDFKQLTAVEPVRLIDKGGFSVLMGLLREEDTQLTRGTLEVLVNLVDPEVPKDQGAVSGPHNAGVFLTHESNVAAALGAANDNDLYVRYHAANLVMRLLAVSRVPTQEAILNQPALVGLALLLLDDKREIVRNEVLLLLARLGEGNAALQNIMAFQGAHEQLLGIVEAERADEETRGGGVIVHDCLKIAISLLAGNPASARFFRESGCVERLPPLLALPPDHHKGHAASVAHACHLVWHLLAAGIAADNRPTIY